MILFSTAYILTGKVMLCKRWHIGSQYATFYMIKGRLLHRKRRPFVKSLIIRTFR